jgi:Flp pilus assembly protein TadD
VNREQRRRAAKLGKQASTADGIISQSGHIADQLARGRRHHQAGQLLQAENCYRKVLAIDPNQFEALHLLGVVSHQLGHSDLAAGLIAKAIALHDKILRSITPDLRTQPKPPSNIMIWRRRTAISVS